MEPNVYDSENPQEYVYDPELNNEWYWKDSSYGQMLQA
jgi:hypothetical protein